MHGEPDIEALRERVRRAYRGGVLAFAVGAAACAVAIVAALSLLAAVAAALVGYIERESWKAGSITATCFAFGSLFCPACVLLCLLVAVGDRMGRRIPRAATRQVRQLIGHLTPEQQAEVLLPMFDPRLPDRNERVEEILASLRRAATEAAPAPTPSDAPKCNRLIVPASDQVLGPGGDPPETG